MERRRLGIRAGRMASAQEHLNTSYQFRKRERLDQVVVRPRLQPPDPVFHLATGREHEHRCLLALAQRGQDGQAIDAGQHAVQHEQIVVARGCQMETVDPVVSKIHDVAFFAQALAKVFGELDLVFDD